MGSRNRTKQQTDVQHILLEVCQAQQKQWPKDSLQYLEWQDQINMLLKATGRLR